MDQRDIRVRRSKVLSLMVEDFSQEEIARQLSVSQPTVSRDMQALDKDAKEVSMFVKKVVVEQSIVWNTYLQIDMLLRDAFQAYVKIEGSNIKGRLQTMQLITSLLGKKVYLLVYTGFDLPHHEQDSSERQYVLLKKMMDELRQQVEKSTQPQVAGGST